MSNEHGRVADDSASQLSQGAGNVAKNVAGNKAKRGLKKALNFIGKKGLLLLKKVLVALAPILFKVILIVLSVILVVFSFKVVFERGEDKRYANEPEYENTTSFDGENVVVDEISEENEAVMLFYKYYASKAMYKIHEDRPDEFDDKLEDYYEREIMFMINHNLLFALDEFVYRDMFRYPEQFIKPVPYDEETLTMKRALENKEIVLKSKNPVTNKEELGLWDYGLAPVLIYKDDEINRKIEGTYVSEDYWCSVSNSVQQRSIHEEFSEQMPEFPEDIHIISKALTMVGEFEFEYVTEKVIVGGLSDGVGEGNEPVTKIKYGEYEQYEEIPIYETQRAPVYQQVPIYQEFCTYRIVNGLLSPICDTRIVGYEQEATGYGYSDVIVGYEQILVAVHDLYKYREGHIYEYRPIVDDIIRTNMDQQFLLTYLSNFETYVPEGVMIDFDFNKRIRQDNLGQVLDTFREQERVNYQSTFAVGGGNNSTLIQALNYFDLVEKYANIYGISDPYMLIAIIAQESGGNPNVNSDGLMQVTHRPGTQICARNFNTGNNECVTVTESGKMNIETNIQLGTMFFQTVLYNDLVDGDYVKALFAYNLGMGGLRYIKDNYPESLNSNEWLSHREESRAHWGRRHYGQESCSISNKSCMGPIYGDHLYIENVMRYYVGSGDYLSGVNVGQINNSPNAWQRTVNFFKGLGNDFLNMFREDVYSYDKAERYFYSIPEDEIGDILTFAKSMEDEKSFLDTHEEFYLEAFNENFEFIFAINQQITTNSSFYNNLYILGQIANLEGYIAPIDKKTARWTLTSPFGDRIHPVKGGRSFHTGIDIGAPIGTPLYAVNDGTVIGVSNIDRDSRGKYVNIKHEDGNVSRYYHMHDVFVRSGEAVERGQLIGTIGNTGMSTGPHLHFEFLIGNVHIDPAPVFFP